MEEPTRRFAGRYLESNVMAHIVVQVGENEVESVITRRSAEEMHLQVGDSVTALCYRPRAQ